MIVRRVMAKDVEPTVDALVSAFAGDPLIQFLFSASSDPDAHLGTFFRTLLEVRVALGMPAVCAEERGRILGAAMGYDTSRPPWEPPQLAAWAQLMVAVDGLGSRLHEYETLADSFMPAQPHYYLGVIGVRAGQQGSGVGARLLGEFCDMSSTTPTSHGVYLETASAMSLRFYLRNGFEVRGEGRLGKDTQLWCVFRPTDPGRSTLDGRPDDA